MTDDNQKYIDKFDKMSEDELINTFLPMDCASYEFDADEEYKFKNFNWMVHQDYLYQLFEEEGLITIEKNGNSTRYSHTQKAKEILRNGGWSKYWKNIADDKYRKEKLETSVIKTNNIQKIAAAMTILIISANCFIDYKNYQITKSNNEENRTKNKLIELQKKYIELQAQNKELTKSKLSYLKYIEDSLALTNLKK